MGELTAGPTREHAVNPRLADLDPASRAWALKRCTPHPIGITDQPLKLNWFRTQS